MKPHTTRAYNSFDIHDETCKITKTSETSRLCDEIGYYLDIEKTTFSHFFPRRFSYNNTKTPYKLELEYYDYDDLGAQMTRKRSCSPSEFAEKWETVAGSIKRILNLFSSCKTEALSSGDLRKKMYIDKTLHYQEQLVTNFSYFKELNKDKEIKVNGKSILNFDCIWGDIENLINKTLINGKPFSLIHGDMCFSNVLRSKRKGIIKFIDPRGSFGSKGIYGDPKYDIAKLLHSFEGGYEYIINDQFELKTNDGIEFRFLNDNLETIKNSFLKEEAFNDPAAKLIEGLIFIGMCSRHYDSPERQIIMYATGLEILNDLL